MPLDSRRVQALFWSAVQHHDAEGRHAVLARECPDDPELRARVEALLRAHDRISDFLSQPLVRPDCLPLASLWEDEEFARAMMDQA